jgi:hypothetical protein
MPQYISGPRFLLIIAVLLVSIGCSVAESKTPSGKQPEKPLIENKTALTSIPVEPDSPADTVRAFYNDLRDKRFREAIFLTNLRPALEGMTDAELKEFQADFEALSGLVPPQVEINGEIITGSDATVTVKLPDNDTDKTELQQIRLRRDGDVWVIMTVDDETAKVVKQQGKNYFYSLRIDTHHDEARTMMDRISKAELAYSMQNGGNYAELSALVEAGLLPPDAKGSDTTGYVYSIAVSQDKRSYTASAVPAVYGKTGKLSFSVSLDPKKGPRLTSSDNGGRPL